MCFHKQAAGVQMESGAAEWVKAAWGEPQTTEWRAPLKSSPGFSVHTVPSVGTVMAFKIFK